MKRIEANPRHSARDSDRATKASSQTTPLITVIASVPGIAEQSLRATLEALSPVHVVGTAAGCLSALQMVRDKQADLVVIDSNLAFEDVRMLLQQLKQEGLRTLSLVLVATNSQVRRALAAGADAVLRRDSAGGQLGAVLAGLHRASLGGIQGYKNEAFVGEQ